jgi:membrane protein
MRRLRRSFEFAVTIAQVAAEHDVTYPAAALAYYGFISQIPVLILVLAVLGDSLASQARMILPTYLTPDAQQLVSEALTSASGGAVAVALAVGVLAWSGANVVLGIQTVIERVEQGTSESLRTQLRDAVSILGSLSLVVSAVVLTNLAFALLPSGRGLAYGKPFVEFGLLTVAFLPLYLAPSRVVSSARGALPGALTAAAGWTILLTAIQFYAANASQYALYGVLSGIIIILTSLYLASVILMIGVVVNTVHADTDAIAGSPNWYSL